MKDRTLNISIKWKLVAYFIGFTLIMLVLLWLFQIVLLDVMYKNIKVSKIRASAKVIAANLDTEHFGLIAGNLALRQELCIRILDGDGNELYQEHTVPGCVIDELNGMGLSMLIRKAEENGGTFVEPRVSRSELTPAPAVDEQVPFGRLPVLGTNRTESLVYVSIVLNSQGEKRVLLLNSSLTPVNATVETLRIQLSYITLVLLFIGLGMALLLSRHISDPIIRLNAASRKLAQGDYGAHFDGEGYLEVAQLADTLNQASRELTKVEELRRELIANVSHDLRTPLTMIVGYAEVMRDIPGENTPENVQVIVDEASRLSLLVDDLMDLSRLQSGTQSLERVRFSLTQSVENIMLRYAKLTEQDGYTIVFEHGEEDAWVYADETRVGQVIYNLINNAIHYTGPDKRVTVRQIVMEDWVRLEVEDTGEGIPKAELPYIWERYYKVKQNHRRAAVGTGLGLSIVRKVLDMHNARYGVVSELDQGSVFWFALPLMRRDEEEPAAGKKEKRAGQERRGRKNTKRE